MFGRGTRGYIAYDVTNKRWVFFKDMWKDASDDVHLELDTYALLKASSVPAVPTAVGGGVIDDQGTWAQKLFDTTPSPAPRVHCRLVLKEVARPLEDYQDAEHLIRIIYHALQGKLLTSMQAPWRISHQLLFRSFWSLEQS